jgi:lipoprotein-anchoring transpeptidase ErfK/SrfK
MTQPMRPAKQSNQPNHLQRTARAMPIANHTIPAPMLPGQSQVTSARALHSAAVVRPMIPVPAGGVRHSHRRPWLLLLALVMAGSMLLVLGTVAVGAVLVYSSSGIFPNVTAAGVAVGGLSQADAAAKLTEAWTTITLVDRPTGQIWEVNPAQIGITLDAAATAERAYQQGRSQGNIFTVVRGLEIEPVLQIDSVLLTGGLQGLLGDIETPAINAGVRFVNGKVEAAPALNGRRVNLEATLAPITQNAAQALLDGKLELVMFNTAPAITDASGMVAAASALLSQPLSVQVFDPVTGDIARWDAPPEQWAGWLTPDTNPNSGTGLTLNVNADAVRGFLSDSSARYLDATRYLDLDKAVSAVQNAVRQNQTSALVRVYHYDRQHIVQPGETIISIAWDYGVPYPWVQHSNPGVTTLSAGQTITIPSEDNFFQYDPISNKRIEVSISEQRVRVYENGGLKWDWIASTGIPDSPTWPGVYQIISHFPNAYAENWDLWMPEFMGVYQPIPGTDFTNGFHGFPTRGGGQLLWENNLGSKVTYGCILLSNENATTLYNWAPEGVVVRIKP